MRDFASFVFVILIDLDSLCCIAAAFLMFPGNSYRVVNYVEQSSTNERCPLGFEAS